MGMWSAKRAIITAVLLAVTPLPSQQQPDAQQGSPTFRARTELVLVPVVVTDTTGKYARNLKKEDFVVREDGKEQKLAVFEPMLAASTPVPKRPEPTATEFTNVLADEGRPGHLIILVLDTVNTPLEDQGYARAEMVRFVKSAQPGAPMALVSLRRSEIKLLHDFTTDPKALLTALEKDSRMPPVIQQSDLDQLEKLRSDLEHAEACGSTRVESQAFESCTQDGGRSDWRQQARDLSIAVKAAHRHLAQVRKMAAMATLDGLQQLAHAFAGVPGRKSLIWATAGFPFSGGAAENAVRPDWFAEQGLLEVYPWYQRTWQILNDANVALYTVDARGLVNPQYNSPRAPRLGTSESIGRAAARHDDRLATMQIFAQMTGGLAFYNRNDLDAAFAGATEDTASYYLLGYYLSSKGGKPGWRKLKVEVKTPSLHVRARSGFFVDAKALSPEATRAGDLELAFRSPLDYTGLKLGVMARGMEDKGATKRVTFRIRLDDPGVLDTADDNHFALQYVGGAISGEGKVVATFNKTLEGKLTPENARILAEKGLYYDVALDLPAGQYKLRFVVRDNVRGILGSASAPFTIPQASPAASGSETAPSSASLPVPSQPSAPMTSLPVPSQPSAATVSLPTPSQPSALTTSLPAPPQPSPATANLPTLEASAPTANIPVRSELLPAPAAVSKRDTSPLPPPTPELRAASAPQPTAWDWGPPGIDEVRPAVAPGVECPQGQVLYEAGNRLNEMVDNISQFEAVEEVLHEEHGKGGRGERPRSTTRKKFAYLASISRPRANIVKIEEDRQSLSGIGAGFPGGIATLGLPSLAFAFHPSMRNSFEMTCEGLGEWQGQPTWLVHFEQRENSPNYLQAYTIAGHSHLVALKGRGWFSAATFQIVHMEAELVRPLPKIHLVRHHQVVDYGMVTFKKQNTELWLPAKAELYFDFQGHRYYRRHEFGNFRLFAVDVSEKVTVPPNTGQ